MHVAGPGKDQNSKYKVLSLLNTYGFFTSLKLKNPKCKNLKSGTMCNSIDTTLNLYGKRLFIRKESLNSNSFPKRVNVIFIKIMNYV